MDGFQMMKDALDNIKLNENNDCLPSSAPLFDDDDRLPRVKSKNLFNFRLSGVPDND